MSGTPPPDPWAIPGWQEAVEGWIDQELDTLDYSISGPIEQVHLRHWSAVLRIPTSDGNLYFKASEPNTAHEPAITQALAGWRPDCVLAPLAIENERGWMLMTDAGVRLREILIGPDDLWHWDALLGLFADVQIDVAEHADEMLTIGAFDHRLAKLPTLYERLLADTEALRLDLPQGVTTSELERLHGAVPQITEMCERLAAYGLPETLHNMDLHDGNVFVSEGRYLFFDWGDASVAHPFFSGVAPLWSIEDRFDLTLSGPELLHLRDVYLEPWKSYGSHADLVAAFELASQLALISGALGWQTLVSQYPEEFPNFVSEWLQLLLGSMSV